MSIITLEKVHGTWKAKIERSSLLQVRISQNFAETHPRTRAQNGGVPSALTHPQTRLSPTEGEHPGKTDEEPISKPGETAWSHLGRIQRSVYNQEREWSY